MLPSQLAKAWRASPPLTAVGLLMLALAPVFGLALIADPRTITGMPAWLKPAKFAVSVGVFCLTLAWVQSFLMPWRRLRAVTGWATALTLSMEVTIISLQAWRGMASHFNVGTPLDGVLYLAMGIGILLQTLLTVTIALALWASSFEDRALGWALRLGVTLSIAGASVGVLMTRPNLQQREEARARGGRYVVNGAHTIGGPDGGPGLPGTGWSLEHGDLRVAHFVGLHALQALPIVALLLARRRLDDARRVRLVLLAAVSHGTLFLILFWQALRAQSIAGPDATTLTALGVWALATAAGAAALGRGHGSSSMRPRHGGTSGSPTLERGTP